MFASTVTVVVWAAMCVTGYSDNLTSFHEPFLLPYRCRTHLKIVEAVIFLC